MDVQDMIDDLGDHGFTDTSTITKVRVLQDALWEIESMRPWPWLETEITLTFDGSSPTPTNMPANFRAALQLKDVDTNTALIPLDEQDLEKNGVDLTKQGVAPRIYYPVGVDSLKVWPIPTASMTVRMRYLKVSAALTSGTLEASIDMPPRHHRLIVLGALVRLYDMEDDPELAQRFQGHYETRLARMVEDIFQRQYDRPDYIRVDDWDSWDYE